MGRAVADSGPPANDTLKRRGMPADNEGRGRNPAKPGGRSRFSLMQSSSATLQAESGTFSGIVGRSACMQEVFDLASRVARSDATVLLTGESGTGKELLAHAIHEGSNRSHGPFVPVNCVAIPDQLLEAELFGHEKGAFTGAHERRRGKFELSDGGTLFLDEVGEMSMTAQAKILRTLQDRQIHSVGSEQAVRVDTRIVAATNKDLYQEVREHHFREDLFYRLNEVSISLPPLRERVDDIPLVVEHFISEFNRQYHKSVRGISDVALRYLMEHSWPGNVRELRNVIKRAMLLMDADTIWLEHLPFDVRLRTEDAVRADSEPLTLEEAEKRHIARVLDMCNWNKSKTARVLRISRPRLDRKIAAYDLRPTCNET